MAAVVPSADEVGGAFTWSPIGAATTYNLGPADAGAGSGVYNSVRQVGSVLGSAAIAALIQARLAVSLPGGAAAGAEAESTGRMPEALQAGFASAMASSMLLPAFAALLGALACGFFGHTHAHDSGPRPAAAESPAAVEVVR